MTADSPHERTIVLDSTPSSKRTEAIEGIGPASPRGPPVEATTRGASSELSSRPGKQVAESSSSAGGAEASHSQPREAANESPTPSPRGNDWLPFSHRISDVPSQWWDNFQERMIGDTGGYGPYEGTISDSNKFVAALQAELKTIEGKWRREVEIRDSQVKHLRQHLEKQTAKIVDLEDKVGQLERDADQQKNRIKYLEEEVSLERHHRKAAQEEAHSARIALGLARIDLQEEQSLQEAAKLLPGLSKFVLPSLIHKSTRLK